MVVDVLHPRKIQRCSLIVLLLPLVASAGCLNAEPADSGSPSDSTAGSDHGDTPTLVYSDCTEQSTTLPVPASYWQPLLPEGLTAVTIDPAGQVGLEVHPVFVCDTPDGGSVGELWIFVVVEPPAAWKHPDASSSHLFPAVAVTTNDTSEAQYRDWGYGNILQRGTVDVTLAQAPVGWMGSALAVGTTSGVTWEEHSIATGAQVTAPGATVRVFSWEDGKVTGAMDVTYPDHQAIFDAAAVFTIRGTDPPLPPPAWPATAELHLPEGHDFKLTYVELPNLG